MLQEQLTNIKYVSCRYKVEGKTSWLRIIYMMMFLVVMAMLSFLPHHSLHASDDNTGNQNSVQSSVVSLKSLAKVEGDTFYLSDIFTGIAPYQDAVLGRSPYPGEDLEIGAVILQRVAKVYHLSWRPSSSIQSVTLRRAANIIPADQITKALRKQIKQSGVDGHFELSYTSGQANKIILPEQYEQLFEFAAFDFDPERDYFRASIVAPSRDNPIERQDISGHVIRLVQAPVLKRSLRNGTLISAADIEMKPVRIDTLSGDTILDKDKIIGKTPERYLVAQKFIRKDDITAPMMVERGQRITILSQKGPIRLSAVGKSMETGSLGDIIRVVNIDSNKTIQAEIIEHGVAQVY